eukprot:6262604-Pyramimonas_sp.AAC.1
MTKGVKVNGKFAWIKPLFSKVRFRDAPTASSDGTAKRTRFWVKSGTQIIDLCGRERASTQARKILRDRVLRDKILRDS